MLILFSSNLRNIHARGLCIIICSSRALKINSRNMNSSVTILQKHKRNWKQRKTAKI